MKKKVFSFDAETDGLWGEPFAIGALVYEYDGIGYVEKARIAVRLPDKYVENEWCVANVLPAIKDMEVTHRNRDQMLADFAEFYLEHAVDADIICHMGYIVEAHVLRLMRVRGLIGDWDGPFPIIDVSGLLLAAGYDPTSVNNYIGENPNLEEGLGTWSDHHPLADSERAFIAYINLCSQFGLTVEGFEFFGEE